ncbi:Nif3-like dinuclear metal center hexameric protein [Schlesneria paludicola]|uniref:Nif3-like dinuclear metal center hexameric protein n=1 Tax=Schlesneria paludicola TaxID=360056 RepID=UPI00029AC370|nr:Nif3-like dinuclear metal center hexameric protein [Schlesneria paludicola]
MTTVRDVCDRLKTIAPLRLAEDWDNVGLIVGDENREIERILTCLTLTSDVADEAVQSRAGLIITHHPILFKPVKSITANTPEGRILLTLIRHEISVYSPHTAWDNSDCGINQQLAERLELHDIRPLRPHKAEEHIKIVTFVPEPQLEALRSAMWNAGAGVIGNYEKCSFTTRGTGSFQGSETTQPAVGRAGQFEQIDEVRLEIVCAPQQLDRVLNALREGHPYEEPAVDLFSARSLGDGAGSGRMGTLSTPMTLAQLNRIVAEKLRQPNLQFVGDPSQTIKRLGIACGAAGEFLHDAHRAGCQAFLTGEVRFHGCLEATELGIALILPGHYATERFAMEALAARLGQEFPGLPATASHHETDPVRTA